MLKKILAIILALAAALSVCGCGGAEDEGDKSDVTPPGNTVETPTPTDDPELDYTAYDFDDTVGVATTFGDGSKETLYVDTSDPSQADNFGTTGGVCEVGYLNKADEALRDPADPYVPEEYGGYAYVRNVNKYTYVNVRVKPQCSKEDFLLADYIEMQVFCNKEVRVSYGNMHLATVKKFTWTTIRYSTEIWRASKHSNQVYSSVTSKSDFYDMLSRDGSSLAGKPGVTEEAAKTDANNGKMLMITGYGSEGAEANDYSFYIADVKIGIEETNVKAGRNFADVSEDGISLPYGSVKEVLFRGVDAVEITTDDKNVQRELKVLVKPEKRFDQLKYYDSVVVRMLVQTEGDTADIYAYVPNNVSYLEDQLKIKTVPVNVWVNVEIHIDFVKSMYPGIYTGTHSLFVYKSDVAKPVTIYVSDIMLCKNAD